MRTDQTHPSLESGITWVPVPFQIIGRSGRSYNTKEPLSDFFGAQYVSNPTPPPFMSMSIAQAALSTSPFSVLTAAQLLREAAPRI